jgi:two-component system phosphate regulon response regulator OmpR
MRRILLIDDDERLAPPLAAYFKRVEFALDAAVRPSEGLAMLRSAHYDAAILDVMLPEMDGFALCREIRRDSDIPIVMLTARGEVMDRVVGLELGADDYLPKPFEPRELLARLRAVLRRVSRERSPVPAAAEDEEQCVPFGDCRLDFAQRHLFGADGSEIEITAAEFDLLALFARHPNRPLSRDQIMERAHHRSWDVFDRSIDLRIMRLRRKIERNPDKPELIKTVRNVGYVYVPQAAQR